MKKATLVDYRKFRWKKLNTPEFNHLKYLIFWPIFGLLFLTVERLWLRDSYIPMHCSWDDAIPFCEFFLIPYIFWFVFLVGIHIYALLFDTESFKSMMKFIILSYSAAILIYILFPNCQELRPIVFERDNLFIRFIQGFYQFDTNTNVCPSIHVIGSVAVMLCAWNSKHFSTTGWRIAFGITTLLISVSTVFLKQHSVLDILAAVPICIIAYIISFHKKKCSIGREKSNYETESRI
jgi:PAP2 superfamily.